MTGSSKTKICRTDLANRELNLWFAKSNYGKNGDYGAKLLSHRPSSVRFRGRTATWSKAGLRFKLKAVRSNAVQSDTVSNQASSTRSRPHDGIRLFVGLPLDAVSDCNTINHARAIAAGLKALKLLGVEGVELPVWWGVAEKEAMGKFQWSSYLALAEMVQKAGLKLHVSLCFHGSKQHKIPLPEWVTQIGEAQPGIYFADRYGQHYKEFLSLSVDNLPVLDGKTPIEVYSEFCKSFKDSFSAFLGSTITGISMGLGPDGELRYPSHHQLPKSNTIPGVGEFQCYDRNMLDILKHDAEASGNPLWGLGGPHDAPSYNQTPDSTNFFKNGGSWESPYGDFFLSWYSNLLIAHGDRLLSLASLTFSDSSVIVSGKVPLMHSWYKTQSHPSELTAGFYNTANRDGYEAVAEMFARNSCKMILPGMDLSDEHQPRESLSSPELLLAQIRRACRKHGVEVSGQNASVSGAPAGLEQIKKNISDENVIDLFTYQRMGAYFFSPDHFPKFTEFVRSLNQPELHSDDLPMEEEVTESLGTSSSSSIHMQAV